MDRLAWYDEAETIVNVMRFIRIEPTEDSLVSYMWLVHKLPRKYAEELWPYCREALKAPVPEWVREQPPEGMDRLRAKLAATQPRRDR